MFEKVKHRRSVSIIKWYVFISKGSIRRIYKYNMELIFNISNRITAKTISVFSGNIVSSIMTGLYS